MKNMLKICLYLILIMTLSFGESGKDSMSSDLYTALTVTANHQYLIAGNNTGSIALWDYKSGKKLRTSKVSKHSIWDIVSVNNGKDIVFTSLASKNFLWNIESNKIIKELKVDDKYSTQGHFFSSASQYSLLNMYFDKDKSVFGLWDYKKNKVIQTFVLNEDETIVNMKLLPKKQQVLVLLEYEKNNQYYSFIRVYNIKSGKKVKEFALEKKSDSLFYALMIISIQENRLLLQKNSKMTLWNTNNGKKVSEITEKYMLQTEADCLFSNDEKNIVLKKVNHTNNGVEMTLCTISIETGKEVKCLSLEINSPIYSWVNVPNTNKIIMSGMYGFTELVKENKIVRKFGGNKSHNTSLVVIKNKYILSGNHYTGISTWDLQSDEKVNTFYTKDEQVTQLALSNDGNFLMATTSNGLKVFDVKNAELLIEYEDSNDSIYSANPKMTKDNRQIYFSTITEKTYTSKLKVIDIKSQEVSTIIKMPKGVSLRNHFLTNDNKYIVLNLFITKNNIAKNELWWWDKLNKKIVNKYIFNKNVPSIQVKNNSIYAYLGHLEVINLSSGKLEKRMILSNSQSDHITTMDINNNETRLILGNALGEITVVDIEKSKIIKHYFAHEGSIVSLKFLDSSKKIVSTARNSKVKIWDLETFLVIQTLL